MREKGQSLDFGLTWPQRILYLLVPLFFSVLVIFSGPLTQGMGWVGTVLFILLGIALGLVTFFVSAGWTYKISLTDSEIRINDKRQPMGVPLDRVGLLVRNGGMPFPTLWVVLRNASVGQEIPAKGVDARTREQIEAYQKRNPGKKLTYVAIPGGYLKSIKGFAEELKNRIPPLTVDDRLM